MESSSLKRYAPYALAVGGTGLLVAAVVALLYRQFNTAVQVSLVVGLIGFVVGKITATFAAPLFPKFVLLLSEDTMIGLVAVIIICALASVVAIRMALKIDPAVAIGG